MLRRQIGLIAVTVVALLHVGATQFYQVEWPTHSDAGDAFAGES